MVADLPSRVSLLSLSFCCPVRGEAEFPARSVVRSVTRSVPFLFFLRCAATTQATHPLRHFGKKKNIKQMGCEVTTVTVTPSHRHTPLSLAARLAPFNSYATHDLKQKLFDPLLSLLDRIQPSCPF